MYRFFITALALILCASTMVANVSADEPVINPQWKEHFHFYPEYQWRVVGEDAWFDIGLYDENWNYISGALIQLKVTEGPNIGASGNTRTDDYGYAYLSYTGTGGVGIDKVLVWYDKNEDGNWDWREEPGGFAEVYWLSVDYYRLYVYYWGSGMIGSPVYIYGWLYVGERDMIEDALIRFEVFDGPHTGTSGSDRTDEKGNFEFSYTGTNVGEDDVIVWYDIDEDGTWDWEEGEPGEFLIIQWLPPYLWLDPYSASPPVGNEMYIEAHVESSWWWPADVKTEWWGEPIPGVSVTFEIISGPNAGLTETKVTDDAGIATFTYVGNSVGVDEIKVYLTDYPESYYFVYVFWLERLKFVKYELVSSKWQKPFYIGVLRAYINNPTQDPLGKPEYFTAYYVTAKISDWPPWVEVIDGEISFEGSYSIYPDQTVKSDDTFTIKTNTSKVKDPKLGITWDIIYYDYWWNLHVIKNVPQHPQ